MRTRRRPYLPTITEHGYVLIFVGKEHRLADVRGYAYEHRLVMEKKLGRRLRRNEVVHHLDENKRNNSPSNLEVMTKAQHVREHKPRLGTAKTHCAKGHRKDLRRKDGFFVCRQCKNEEERERYHREHKK
jgi:HNH endonuclease